MVPFVIQLISMNSITDYWSFEKQMKYCADLFDFNNFKHPVMHLFQI